MKRQKIISFAAMTALMFLSLSAFAAPVKQSSKTTVAETNTVPQAMPSLFTMPSNPSQGRDPFFPNSKRPYESATAKPGNDASDVILRGIVGDVAVINNHSFRGGEEGDISTAGGRMHIRCISVKKDAVVIEVDGERHELQIHDIR